MFNIKNYMKSYEYLKIYISDLFLHIYQNFSTQTAWKFKFKDQPTINYSYSYTNHHLPNNLITILWTNNKDRMGFLKGKILRIINFNIHVQHKFLHNSFLGRSDICKRYKVLPEISIRIYRKVSMKWQILFFKIVEVKISSAHDS